MGTLPIAAVIQNELFGLILFIIEVNLFCPRMNLEHNSFASNSLRTDESHRYLSSLLHQNVFAALARWQL
jgi:hypothetical protein